jgi:AraC-like DNA-binding protein
MRESRYWRYRGLYLAQPAIDHILTALGLARLPGFTTNAINDARLIRGFTAAHQAFADSDDALARERLIAAFGDLFALPAAGGVVQQHRGCSRAAVDRALAMINDGFRDRLTVDRLAAAVGLSPFQLIRQFNRATGMPPHAHLVRRRLHVAIRAIRRGASLPNAATSAGFYDQSALTRHFRRAYGITPGQYQRARG